MRKVEITISCLYLALLCLAVSGIVLFYKSGKPPDAIVQMLESLTPHERYCLDLFLKRTFLFTEYSYVLFGHKPFALRSFSKMNKLFFNRASPGDLNSYEGLEICKKHAHLFDQKKFIIRFRESEEYIDLELINKDEFLRVINENIAEVEELTGKSISPEDFLREFVENGNFRDGIGCPEVLFGIILGYGRSNSHLFHEKFQLLNSLNNFHLSSKKSAFLESKLSEINRRAGSFGKKICHDGTLFPTFLQRPFISLPFFVADPNDIETQELERLYKKDREEIIKIASQPNASEIICKRLAS